MTERDVTRCRFDGPVECAFLVERKDGEATLTTPFLTQSEEHARDWCAQTGEEYHYRPARFRRCHCGRRKLLGRRVYL